MAIDSSKISLGLPSLPSDNLPPDLWDDFKTMYNAIRNLANGVSVYAGVDAPSPEEWADSPAGATLLTGNLTRLYLPAAVIIIPGQMLNIFDNAGTMSVRLASASSAATMMHGIANTSAAIGELVEIQFLRSYVTSVGGMVPGTLYWLSTVAGAVQNSAPVAAGTIRQAVGLAMASSTMLMDSTLLYWQN